MPPVHIALKTASNLRDLGGWPTGDGRVVRRGRIFRAPALAPLAAEDTATVAALGLATVCDLRGTWESERLPVRIGGARHIPLPIEPSHNTGLGAILRQGRAADGVTPAEIMALLTQVYVDLVVDCAPQFSALFALLLAHENLPLLLHCSAGKDRTGVASALVLTALGVHRDDVMADYLATNTHWRQEMAAAFTLAPEIHTALFSAHPELLEASFAAIEAGGGLDAYFAGIGVGPASRDRLAAHLLEG